MSIVLIKENGFAFKKPRNRRYLAESRRDAGDADDMVLLTSTPAQAEILMDSLEQTAEHIGH